MSNAFDDFVNWIELEAEDGIKDVVAGLAAMAQAIFHSGGQLLLSAALQAVETEAADLTGKSGSAKFASATQAVVGTLESQGISVILSAVQSGVQAAFHQMEANRAQEAAGRASQ